jgi:phage terminase large subunit
MVLLYRSGDRYIVTDEYHQRNKVINVKWLMDDFYRFHRDAKQVIADNSRPELIEYCNHGYKDDTKSRHGAQFYPCHKYPGSVLDEINTLNNLYQSKRILISDRCLQLIKETMSWQWREGAKKEVPDDLDEDTCRALGYAIMSIEKGSGQIKVF